MWTRLGSISSAIQYGLSNSAEQTGTHRLLRITDIQDGKVDWETVPFTTVTEAETYLLTKGDIVFARTGATVGKSFLITETPYPSVYASYLIRIRLLDNVLPEYIYQFFNSQCYWDQITDKSVGVGQPNCNGTSLKELLIPLPPVNEQSRIVPSACSVMEYVVSIEDQRNILLEDISTIKSKILDLAIRGKLVPQNPNDEPASVLLERIRAEKKELIRQGKIKRDKKESVIFKGEDNSYYLIQNERAIPADETIVFDLPDSWCWTTLPTIANVELGKTLDRAKNTGMLYPYLRSVNIKWGDIDLSDLNETRFEDDELEKYSVIKNDLLICEGGDVGRCCVWNIDEVFLYQNALHRARMYANIEPKFYQYVLMSYESKGILKRISNGVTIKHLTGTTLSFMPIPLPPVDEQLRIIETIELLFAQLDAIKESLN